MLDEALKTALEMVVDLRQFLDGLCDIPVGELWVVGITYLPDKSVLVVKLDLADDLSVEVGYLALDLPDLILKKYVARGGQGFLLKLFDVFLANDPVDLSLRWD